MRTLSVFEHDVLLVGDIFEQRHYDMLAERLGQKDLSSFPYYSLIKSHHQDGVKFRQYVGAIQVGDLTIEILPKLDKGSPTVQDGKWKDLLVYMLCKVYKLQIRSESMVHQQLRHSTLLDLFIDRFLNETELILHHGLIKTYSSKRENLNSLKGRLLIQKHIRINAVHQERFFVQHTVYDRSHVMNRILRQTLMYIITCSRNPVLVQRAKSILDCFPEIPYIQIDSSLFLRLVYDRKTEAYKEAMSLSELILLSNMPNLQSGKVDSLAMLFDMNRLWEEFVYVTLRRYLPGDYKVRAQVGRQFWASHLIRPDILIEGPSGTVVLDTKWKQLENEKPADGDLHQMFVYSRYFNAYKVALLYPESSGTPHRREETFAKTSTSPDIPGELWFFPVPQQKGKGRDWELEITDKVKAWL